MTAAVMPNTVYGSLMHHSAELQALGETAHQPPYNAPPKTPVLYIKPANTFNAFGGSLNLHAPHTQICARSCASLIYQRSDWRIALFCDFTLPHSSFYRPPLRFNALDGSLALPQNSLAWQEEDLKDVCIETWVNGACTHSYQTADWVCSVQEQLQRVSEFIAWETGDVLMLGCPPDAPLVKLGDVVEARMNGQIFTRTIITQEAA